MKSINNLYKIILYIIIFLFFVIPPIFTFGENSTSINWSFNLGQIILFLLSLFLYYFSKKSNIIMESDYLISFKKKLIYSLLTFICLFLLYFLINFIAFLTFKTKIETSSILKPQNFSQWVFCILNFFTAAFFEEIIYRLYLPDGFTKLFEKNSKLIIILSEIIALVFFALGHLYLGIFSVINAGGAYLLLRALYKKTNSIFYSIIIHFLYNLIIIIIM